jgi:hypothetical protein
VVAEALGCQGLWSPGRRSLRPGVVGSTVAGGRPLRRRSLRRRALGGCSGSSRSAVAPAAGAASRRRSPHSTLGASWTQYHNGVRLPGGGARRLGTTGQSRCDYALRECWEACLGLNSHRDTRNAPRRVVAMPFRRAPDGPGPVPHPIHDGPQLEGQPHPEPCVKITARQFRRRL